MIARLVHWALELAQRANSILNNPQIKIEMNTYRYENRPYDIPYMELKMVDEEKSTPWKTVPPSWKNSSSKGGRTANQIKKDRKRKKMNKRK